MRRIYLDANATTPVLLEVIEAMQPYWSDRFGNASAVHGFGRHSRAGLEAARDQMASLLHASAAEIIFTSGGTESDNQALSGLLNAGDHLIVSAIEHDAVLHTANALRERGVEVTRVPCDGNGIVHPDAVRAALTPRTKLVSVMVANNETGAIQPIPAIAEIAHSAGAWMHTDAVQACGKLVIKVQALGCDMLSVSGHKMHGPQGVGVLWVRGGIPLRSLLHGGSHERRRRAGTENVPGIVGLGKAAELAGAWLAQQGPQSLCALRDLLEAKVLSALPNVRVNSANAPRLPNTSSLRFAGVSAEEVVIALDLQGIAVSGGSACQSGTLEPSHVLHAMGLSDAEARSSIRISCSRLTTADDVDEVARVLIGSVNRMRTLRAA